MSLWSGRTFTLKQTAQMRRAEGFSIRKVRRSLRYSLILVPEVCAATPQLRSVSWARFPVDATVHANNRALPFWWGLASPHSGVIVLPRVGRGSAVSDRYRHSLTTPSLYRHRQRAL
jgi:hypothetical protein